MLITNFKNGRLRLTFLKNSWEEMAVGFSPNWRCTTCPKRRSLCNIDWSITSNLWRKHNQKRLTSGYRVITMLDRRQGSAILTILMSLTLTLQDGSSLRYQELHLLQDMVTLQFLQAPASSYSEEREPRELCTEICMHWTLWLWHGTKAQRVVVHLLQGSITLLI